MRVLVGNPFVGLDQPHLRCWSIRLWVWAAAIKLLELAHEYWIQPWSMISSSDLLLFINGLDFGHSKRENEDKWIRSLNLMLTYIKKIELISFTLSCYLNLFFYCWRCNLQCLFFVFFVWIDCVCNFPFRIVWPHEINLEHDSLQCYNGSFSFGDLLNLIATYWILFHLLSNSFLISFNPR